MKNIYYQKTFLITGASSGIGKELTKLLCDKYGAFVLGVARNKEKLESVKQNLTMSKSFTYLTCDLSYETSFSVIKNYVISNGISLFGVINCAGILPKFSNFLSSSVEELKSTFNTNFYSVVYSAKTLIPVILQNKTEKRKPVFINVSSSSALCSFAGIASYASSKSAVKSFTECLREEVKDVNVVSVMPGFTDTDVFRTQNCDEKTYKLIKKFASDPQKVAKIILRKTARGKKNIVIGLDAKVMKFFFRLIPNKTAKIISDIIKKSKNQMFENVK